MYRSPSSSFENFQELCNLFKEVYSLNYTHILLLGDYNIPGIDWKSYTTEKGIDSIEYKFIETIRDLFIPAYRRTHQMERVISTECARLDIF